MKSVRSYCLAEGDCSEHHVQRPTADFDRDNILNERPHLTPQQAPLWQPDDFVPGHLSSKIPFWREEILRDRTPADSSTLLGWLQGVSVHDFIDESSRGVFQGHQFNGAEVSQIELPNHVPEEHNLWVDTEIAKLEQKGCIVPWQTVADVSENPRPHIVLPLGVEPKKPRLIWDGRWLNLMCRHVPFKMDGVGNVAQCSWQGAYQVTLDHKSGHHHVPLDKDSWQYFGFFWRGMYYVWTVLCFGWCSSPYIYHTLSAALAQYLRARDMPVLVWIDDFYLCNFRSTRKLTSALQLAASEAATYLALSVFYRAGYFMSVDKCELKPSTRLVFLGIVCDSILRRFEVPKEKLVKLEAILYEAISTKHITFTMLEKLAGKCTSMTVAVPVAGFYTHHMYKHIAAFQRKGGKKSNMGISVTPNSGLRRELEKWLEVRHRSNG